METEPRVYAAELLGTFVLVFVGTTSVVASGRISARSSCWSSFRRRGANASARARLSGASFNPVRTFGPDLVGDTWTGIWIYFTAPPLGAAFAWLIHSRVVVPAPEAPTAPIAEVGEDPERGR